LSLLEFLSRTGGLRTVDQLTEEAYRYNIEGALLDPDQGHDREDLWHVSFHGSSFPGDNPKACGRRALYSMVDTPRAPFRRRLMQQADAGKDIENRLAQNWHDAGMLLTPPPGEPQMEFFDGDHWLVSTVDSMLLPLSSDMPIVCEIKSKSWEVIDAMQRLVRGPDEKHVFQLKCQLGLAHEAGERTVYRCYNTNRLAIKMLVASEDGEPRLDFVCAHHKTDKCLREVRLLAPTRGKIYYVSRDAPSDSFEFHFDYDPEFMRRGREVLANWREHFIEGALPQTNFDDKRFSHPFGWLWGDEPCKWCDFGQVCREDHREAVKTKEHTRLKDSAAVEHAGSTRRDYTYDAVRERVFKRWKMNDPKVAKRQ